MCVWDDSARLRHVRAWRAEVAFSGDRESAFSELWRRLRTAHNPAVADPNPVPATRLGFFRANARSCNGLGAGVSLVAMSLFVARDSGWPRPHVGTGAWMAPTLFCLCRATRSG